MNLAATSRGSARVFRVRARAVRVRLTYAPLSVDELPTTETKIQLLFPVLGVSFTVD
jgi:hypothetical protein